MMNDGCPLASLAGTKDVTYAAFSSFILLPTSLVPRVLYIMMAEREGFEPPELSLNGFQDRRLKPLGHLSVPENSLPPHRGLRWTINYSLFCCVYFLGTIVSAPPIYFLSASGTSTVPSRS